MKMIFFAIIWLIGKILLLLYRVDVKGLEHLPKSGALLCPNHASNIDPVLIGLCLPLDYHLHFMAKAELFEKPALAWLIRTLGAFPVQRDGRDIQSVKTTMKVLNKGEKEIMLKTCLFSPSERPFGMALAITTVSLRTRTRASP